MSQEGLMCYARPELMHFRKPQAYLEGTACRMMSAPASPASGSSCPAPKQPSRGPVKVDNAGACCQASTSGSHLPDAVPLQGNLLDSQYRTDEFRINHFKVSECTNPDPHDWTLCAFAHVGEKARRRNPAIFKYVSTACPDFRKGTCKRGDGCPFAHGVFETWLHPGRYRTQLCKDGRDCDRPVCFFAHTIQELRTPSLPASLENSPDGMAFAAFFGGPTYAGLLPQPQPQPQPQPIQGPPVHHAHGRARQPPAGLHLQRHSPQQQLAAAGSLSAAAAVLHQQQQISLQQAQHALSMQPPSSPYASSASSDASPGLAELQQQQQLHGCGEDDWVKMRALTEQLRRAAAVSGIEGALAPAMQLPPAAPQPPSATSALTAWLLSRGCTSSQAIRAAAELGSMLDTMPEQVAGLHLGADLAGCLATSLQGGNFPLGQQQLQQVPLAASSLPMLPTLGVGPLPAAAAPRAANPRVTAAMPEGGPAPAASEAAALPAAVPPVLASIWGASPQEMSELQALRALRAQLDAAAAEQLPQQQQEASVSGGDPAPLHPDLNL